MGPSSTRVIPRDSGTASRFETVSTRALDLFARIQRSHEADQCQVAGSAGQSLAKSWREFVAEVRNACAGAAKNDAVAPLVLRALESTMRSDYLSFGIEHALIELGVSRPESVTKARAASQILCAHTKIAQCLSFRDSTRRLTELPSDMKRQLVRIGVEITPALSNATKGREQIASLADGAVTWIDTVLLDAVRGIYCVAPCTLDRLCDVRAASLATKMVASDPGAEVENVYAFAVNLRSALTGS